MAIRDNNGVKDNCELVFVFDREMTVESLTERYHCFGISDFKRAHTVLDKIENVFVAACMDFDDEVVASGNNMTLGNFLNFGQLADEFFERSAGLRVYAYISNYMKPQGSRLNGAVRA